MGILQAWMRELFSYVIPDCFFFFLVRPRVLWEELKPPRAHGPAPLVVVELAGAEPRPAGGRRFTDATQHLERNHEIQPSFADLNGNSLGLKLQFEKKP